LQVIPEQFKLGFTFIKEKIMLPTDIQSFAVWIMTAGAAGWIVSIFYERVTAFQSLTPNQKRWVVFFTFILLPFAGVGLQVANGMTFPLPVTGQAWVTLVGNMLLQGIAAWSASQWAHGQDPVKPI
jgi:hypothetical protein